MIYELRVYDCVPGRLPALLSRFENHTLRIWSRLNIRPLAFFSTVVGESSNRLTYLLAWESMAERERIWPVFLADDEWLSVRTATEAGGAIVERVRNSLLEACLVEDPDRRFGQASVRRDFGPEDSSVG